ncbi:MAG: hypothetical protein AB1758_13405 [Candidatus Eremiobacterota bacterium]
MFGIGLFAVSLLLLFGLFPTAHRSATLAKNVSMATTLARETMEEQVLAQTFDSIAATGGPVPVVLASSSVVRGVDVQDVDNFTYEIVLPPTGDAELKHVVVLVRWQEGATTHVLRLQTYVSKI